MIFFIGPRGRRLICKEGMEFGGVKKIVAEKGYIALLYLSLWG